jgi:peptide deformylase
MILMSVDPQALTLEIYPAKILVERSSEVDPADPNVQAVAQRMIEMMYEHNGVGLAAPQVGLPWRLFVTRAQDCAGDAVKGVAWINPVLEVVDETVDTEEEGCLSLPDVHGNIRRPIAIRISGHDANGHSIMEESDEFIARVWQHENDHLNGVLIIDKMSAMDRLVNRKVLRTLERQQ